MLMGYLGKVGRAALLTSAYYPDDLVASLIQLVDNGAWDTTMKVDTWTGRVVQ
jgi:hypothetical protein